MPALERLAVVLLSGGLDSTTVATHAVQAGYQVRGLCISYGQRHAREIRSAEAVAQELGIPLQVADASFYADLASFSALTDMAIEVPAERSMEAMSSDIPITYVPLRNTFFVTLAAAALESWLLERVERDGVDPLHLEGTVFVGANAIDYSGYPDCRPEFYDAMVRVLMLGSKAGSAYGIPLRIEAPIIEMSKEQIVRYGSDIGAPLALTWSCYTGGERPCGTCDSCLLRAQGFAVAGIPDPALAPA